MVAVLKKCYIGHCSLSAQHNVNIIQRILQTRLNMFAAYMVTLHVEQYMLDCIAEGLENCLDTIIWKSVLLHLPMHWAIPFPLKIIFLNMLTVLSEIMSQINWAALSEVTSLRDLHFLQCQLTIIWCNFYNVACFIL